MREGEREGENEEEREGKRKGGREGWQRRLFGGRGTEVEVISKY